MRLSLRFTAVPVVLAALAAAGCGGGSVTAPSIQNQTPRVTAPTAAPVVTASPAPAASPATSVITNVSLASGTALTNAMLATSVPAPSGYSQSINLPIVNAAAGTSVSVSSGTAVPPSLVPLGARRSVADFRRPASTGTYNVVFYDSITPTANITVAGNVTFTQGFPVPPAAGSYYLTYYDTTQATPAWQTIAGRVVPSGNSLTFSGPVNPVTLVANHQYGFATFTGVLPSATPPPTPQTLLYFGNNNSGLTIATQAGAIVSTLAIPNQSFDLDDAGNVYAFNHNGTPSLAKYAPGSISPATTYTPSLPNRAIVTASGAGELAAVHYLNGSGILTTDVWDTGKSGTPSRILMTMVTGNGTGFAFVMTHDGTLYLPDHSSTGQPRFDIFPPGASTPSATIPETIVPPSQYANFTPNYAAVGPDGVLYVTEYTYTQPDPNAGIYIYPPAGSEGFIAPVADANGPGPDGIDVDASRNIYVVNDNTAVLANSTCQGDSLPSITEYNAQGTAIIRTVNSPTLASSFPLTVTADGTAFLSTFPIQLQNGCNTSGVAGIYSIAPGSGAITQVSNQFSNELVLFDGTHKTNPYGNSGSRGQSAHMGGRGGLVNARKSDP
jgi:hypothetical protein